MARTLVISPFDQIAEGIVLFPELKVCPTESA